MVPVILTAYFSHWSRQPKLLLKQSSHAYDYMCRSASRDTQGFFSHSTHSAKMCSHVFFSISVSMLEPCFLMNQSEFLSHKEVSGWYRLLRLHEEKVGRSKWAKFVLRLVPTVGIFPQHILRQRAWVLPFPVYRLLMSALPGISYSYVKMPLSSHFFSHASANFLRQLVTPTPLGLPQHLVLGLKHTHCSRLVS